jgi:phage terminase Nu1 subunit (DNA packaging protein)
MAAISKTALAALLGVSKPRISQYVSQGLPVLADGKIDREQALSWLNRNKVESGPSGSPGVKSARALAKRLKPKAPTSSRPLNPVNAALVNATAELVSRSATAARLSAQALGLPVKASYQLAYLVQRRLGDDAEDFLGRVGVQLEEDAFGEAVGPLHWALEPDWAALAGAAGERFDETAWDRELEGMEAAHG